MEEKNLPKNALSPEERQQLRWLLRREEYRRWVKGILFRWVGYVAGVLGVLGTFWDKIVSLFAKS